MAASPTRILNDTSVAGGGAAASQNMNSLLVSPTSIVTGSGLATAASFELDLIEAYEEVVRVISSSSRPGTARRDAAERVAEFSESLLAVLDRLHGSRLPEWRPYRALALQLLAVARRFGELSAKIEGDHTGRTPWGATIPGVHVDTVAAGCPLPFIVASVGNVAAHMLLPNPRTGPPMTLHLDEVMEYVDAVIFASCELYCNSVKAFASLCAARNAQRTGARGAHAQTHAQNYVQAGESVDELFVLHCAFEDDDTFARFWARRFGTSTLSVSGLELINALDGEVFAGPERTRRAVVEVAVSNAFDVHTDGMVDVGAVAAICAGTRAHVFPTLLEMLAHAAKGPALNAADAGAQLGRDANGGLITHGPEICDRCSRLEAELALERRRNAELRAELNSRPKSHMLLSQLDSAHRTIQSLQLQMGLAPKREPLTYRDAQMESHRLRRAVLGVGLRQNQQ